MSRLLPRLPVIVVGVLSAPFVAFPLAAGAYIAYSLVVDDWYRDMFGDYGAKLLVLYTFYALGVVAAATISAPRFRLFGGGVRLTAIVLCVAGLVAAGFLENEFWNDADRLIARGILFIPYLLWLLVGLAARWRRRASPGGIALPPR